MILVHICLYLLKSHSIFTSDNYDGQIYIVNETAFPGYVIATFGAQSNQEDSAYQGLTFALIKNDGSQSQYDDTFMTNSPTPTEVRLTLRTQLNYKLKVRYTLRLRVSVSKHKVLPTESAIHITSQSVGK